MSIDNFIKEELKNSNITPGIYKVSENAKAMTHTVITVDNIPLIGLGEQGDVSTEDEAFQLLQS